eukprot:m.100733 g.100733  ORF g.100733 m.100733 type:complete len:171 (+) comp10359_c0_seq2:79-591(+)
MALLRTCLGMSTVWMTTTAVSMAMSSPPSPSPQCSPIGPRTCTITAPPGFTATGNGWFRMSPAQNHSHPNGDNRPAPYPPNGHTNISIECCALYCLSDPECKGFHVYQPCTWTGNHSNPSTSIARNTLTSDHDAHTNQPTPQAHCVMHVHSWTKRYIGLVRVVSISHIKR